MEQWRWKEAKMGKHGEENGWRKKQLLKLSKIHHVGCLNEWTCHDLSHLNEKYGTFWGGELMMHLYSFAFTNLQLAMKLLYLWLQIVVKCGSSTDVFWHLNAQKLIKKDIFCWIFLHIRLCSLIFALEMRRFQFETLKPRFITEESNLALLLQFQSENKSNLKKFWHKFHA